MNARTVPPFSPSYTFPDVLTGLAGIGKVRAEDSIAGLLPNGRSTYFLDSGRTALFVILQSMRLSTGSPVYVQPFTCLAVIEAIEQAGLSPVFIDIDPQTYTLDVGDLKERYDGGPVLAIHTFGHAADLDPILALVGRDALIEDCAHAPLGTYKDRPLGTFGAYAFYSFRLGKPLSAGGGGVVTVLPDAAPAIQAKVNSLPEYSRLEELQHVLRTAARSFAYRPSFYEVASKFRADPLRALEVPGAIWPHAIRSSDLHVAHQKVPELASIIERQRKNSLRLCQALQASTLECLVERPWARCTYAHFPIRVSRGRSRESLADYLAAQRIRAFPLYSISMNALKARYHFLCPVATESALRTLVIPNHEGLSDSQVEGIAQALLTWEGL